MKAARNPLAKLTITPETLRLIDALDEFKGRWQAAALAPERHSALRRVATIESVGSSARIEGVRLDDSDMEELLSRVDRRSFRSTTRAGRSRSPRTISSSCIRSSSVIRRDDHHRGHYKTTPSPPIRHGGLDEPSQNADP